METQLMTFPIKKRINAEPFIDERAALYKYKMGAITFWQN